MLVQTLNRDKENADKYAVKFFHNKMEKKGKIGNQHLKKGQRFTICTIENISKENSPVAQGFSFCSMKDNFCRRTGRMNSFFDALKQLPRPERKPLTVASLLKGI